MLIKFVSGSVCITLFKGNMPVTTFLAITIERKLCFFLDCWNRQLGSWQVQFLSQVESLVGGLWLFSPKLMHLPHSHWHRTREDNATISLTCFRWYNIHAWHAWHGHESWHLPWSFCNSLQQVHFALELWSHCVVCGSLFHSQLGCFECKSLYHN